MQKTNLLELPSLVIIIDCWNNRENTNYLNCLENIKTLCTTNPNVQAIGLASYTKPDKKILHGELSNEEPWHESSKELFYNSVRWETLRHVWENASFTEEIFTHHIVREMPPVSNQVRFQLWNDLQLLYYCNYINPGIKNIYVVGASWSQCLEFREVGYKYLDCLNKFNLFNERKNILSDLRCVLDTNDVLVEQVQYPWKKLNDNLVILDE